jgi:hypothetical protein
MKLRSKNILCIQYLPRQLDIKLVLRSSTVDSLRIPTLEVTDHSGLEVFQWPMRVDTPSSSVEIYRLLRQ